MCLSVRATTMNELTSSFLICQYILTMLKVHFEYQQHWVKVTVIIGKYQFGYLDISLTWFYIYLRSRSSRPMSLHVSLSIGKQEVGLRLKDILILNEFVEILCLWGCKSVDIDQMWVISHTFQTMDYKYVTTNHRLYRI